MFQWVVAGIMLAAIIKLFHLSWQDDERRRKESEMAFRQRRVRPRKFPRLPV